MPLLLLTHDLGSPPIRYLSCAGDGRPVGNSWQATVGNSWLAIVGWQQLAVVGWQ